MASARHDPRTGKYFLCFRFGGKQYQRALKTTKRKEALAAAARADEMIQLIERGRLEVPNDVDPATFILSDGRMTKPQVIRRVFNLKELFDTYRSSLPEGAKEVNTIKGEDRHIKHLLRHLGTKPIAQSTKYLTT